MATYTWEFGSAAAGLQFSVVYDDSTGKFTVRVQEGALNVNALWFSNGDMTSDGNTTLTKRDNNLNMNGSNTVWNDDGTPSSEKIVWDSYLPVSSPGLTSTPPDSYIVAGSAHDSFEICAPVGFNPAGITLGVRATSTTTAEGSIKWVDKTAAYDDGADPWGDNPFVILPEDSAIGDPGGPGDNGDPGADGTDVTVDGANGANGANGSNGSTTGAPVAPTPGIAGQPGANGDTGGNGGNGENGGPGGDGGLVIPVPQDAAFTAILINASDGAVEIRGGDGGAGGNGGDGGPGGDGGDGGDGGKGGNGGNGAATGNTASRSGAAGGAGGNGGSGGDGGDGGNGGNGGDGGDGGNAIENGVVNDVYIIGSNNVTILGGAGGAGGLGGAAGGGGTAGDGGDGGLGGAGGTGTAPSGVNGASGTPGGTGSDGTDGTAGVAGANGQDGADAAAFSDAVNVYANLMGPNEFTGFLTISGSNYNDTMFMGSVGSMIYATTGNDAYTFGAGPDTIVFTSAAQSNGTTSTDTIFSWGSTDVINVSALFGGTLSFVGDTTITPLTANSLGWYESGGDTHVVADVTGDGSADLHLILNGTSLGLTASDFVL